MTFFHWLKVKLKSKSMLWTKLTLSTKHVLCSFFFVNDKSFDFFFGNSPEMYLWWIDHHLCWVCKEDKLLWTGPPSIVMFSVPVTQRLTSWGEETSQRERYLRLYSTNASAPADVVSANQRPVLVTTDQSEAGAGDKLFVNYWATVWSTYVSRSQATHLVTSLVTTPGLSIHH